MAKKAVQVRVDQRWRSSSSRRRSPGAVLEKDVGERRVGVAVSVVAVAVGFGL